MTSTIQNTAEGNNDTQNSHVESRDCSERHVTRVRGQSIGENLGLEKHETEVDKFENPHVQLFFVLADHFSVLIFIGVWVLHTQFSGHLLLPLHQPQNTLLLALMEVRVEEWLPLIAQLLVEVVHRNLCVALKRIISWTLEYRLFKMLRFLHFN